MRNYASINPTPFLRSFVLNFNYRAKAFVAKVQRFNLIPVRYLVLFKLPKNYNNGAPFIFKANVETKELEHPVSYKDEALVEVVATEIEKHCSSNSIEIA